MANELTTAGISLKYAVESTAGTKPSSFSTAIPNVTSIGATTSDPEMYDVTDLSDTETRRKIKGLQDISDVVTLGVNLTKAFATAWATLVSAAETAIDGGKKTWFEVSITGYGAYYFTGIPVALQCPAIDTGAVLTDEVRIALTSVNGFEAEA